MTPDQEQKFDAIIETMQTEGWSYIMKDIKTEVDNLNNIFAMKTEAELAYRQGVVQTLLNFSNLEERVKVEREIADETPYDANAL